MLIWRSQIVENLVAAEFGRPGYIVAPFVGNVATYDLLAAASRGYAILVQVKAIDDGSRQFSADTSLNIEVINGERVVKGAKKYLTPRCFACTCCRLVAAKTNSICFASATCRYIA